MAIEHLVNRLGEQFGNHLPASVQAVRGELEDTLKLLLREALGRMDLLTRDEFDVQQRLLGRTRQRVTELEAQVAALEARVTTLEQGRR